MYRSSLQPTFSKNFYKAESFKTENHADELKSLQLTIYNPLDNNTSHANFFAGPNYDLCRTECRTLVHELKEFVHQNADQLTPALTHQKKDEINLHLTALESHLCDADIDFFSAHKETIYGEGKTKLAELLLLLKKDNIPIDLRMNVLISAVPTMALCSGGLMTALHNAVSSLKYSTAGISGAAQRVKNQMIDHLIAEHIKKENHAYKVGEEIHLINGYYNAIAEDFGTSPRKDDFIGLFKKSITKPLAKKCTKHIIRALRPDTLANHIAQRYLDKVMAGQKDDLTKPIQNSTITHALNKLNESIHQLEPEFGPPPLLTAFIKATDETYESYNYLKQPAVIAKHFIEKLHEAKLINNYTEINLTEHHPDGVVKQIGNIFWRQRSTHECEEISPEALLAISPLDIQTTLEKQNISVEDQASIFIEMATHAHAHYHPNFEFENSGPWFAALSDLLKLSRQTECEHALHLAAAVGCQSGMRDLISVGADINARDTDSNTPLIVATQHNRLEVIEALINQKCDTSLQNNLGNTALMVAAADPQGAAAVKLLLPHSEPKNTPNWQGENAYTRAAGRGSLESVCLLLGLAPMMDTNQPFKEQASNLMSRFDQLMLFTQVNSLDSSGQSMLHAAAKNGRTEMIELLIWAEASVNLKDPNDHTPLMTAVVNNRLNAIKPLVWAGSILDKEIPFAFSEDNPDVLKALSDAGIFLHNTSKQGSTILMLSAMHGKNKILEYLLCDAEPGYINAPWIRGYSVSTALSLATEAQNMTATTLLLQAGAQSAQLLTNIAAYGPAEQLRHLISAGADVTARGLTGMTALMMAAQNGKLDNVKCLCEVLSPDEINAKLRIPQVPYEVTALWLASKANQADVVDWLISKGAIVEPTH